MMSCCRVASSLCHAFVHLPFWSSLAKVKLLRCWYPATNQFCPACWIACKSVRAKTLGEGNQQPLCKCMKQSGLPCCFLCRSVYAKTLGESNQQPPCTFMKQSTLACCTYCRSVHAKTFGFSDQHHALTLLAGSCKPWHRIIELAVIGGHSGKVFSSLVNSEGVKVSIYSPPCMRVQSDMSHTGSTTTGSYLCQH